MKNKIFAVLTVLLMSLFSQLSLAVETNSAALTDLNELITRINERLHQGKNTEADLADNLKEFDSLLARHKGESPQDLKQILVMKAQLYRQVLDDPEKAIESFKQIKREFPDQGDSADAAIKALQDMADKKKIQAALAPGTKFPDFAEKDLAGKPLSVSNYTGKVVLVDFWATWCGPCLMELPNVVQTYEKYHSKGFEIIGISLDDDRQQLERFIRSRNMPWPEFFDGEKWENKLVMKYGVTGIPANFLLDREGKIIARDLRGDELDSAVPKALDDGGASPR